MATAQSHTATTAPSVPAGAVFELQLSDLTREEFEALFGADEQETQPMGLQS